MVHWWVDVSGSDVVYSEGVKTGRGREGKQCGFSATFDFAKQGESLFSGISTVKYGNSAYSMGPGGIKAYPSPET